MNYIIIIIKISAALNVFFHFFFLTYWLQFNIKNKRQRTRFKHSYSLKCHLSFRPTQHNTFTFTIKSSEGAAHKIGNNDMSLSYIVIVLVLFGVRETLHRWISSEQLVHSPPLMLQYFEIVEDLPLWWGKETDDISD